MLALVIMMAIFSMGFELMIIKKFPFMLRLLEHPKHGPMISLGFSFALSLALGVVFGAGGLIIMMGGIMSTVMMQPIYALIRNGKWHRSVALTRRASTQIGSVFANLMKIVKLAAMIVAVPVYILIKIISVIGVVCEFLTSPLKSYRKYVH